MSDPNQPPQWGQQPAPPPPPQWNQPPQQDPQQPPWGQQPQQPNQPPWGAPQSGWITPEPERTTTSIMAVLAGVVLLLFGLFITLAGVVVASGGRFIEDALNQQGIDTTEGIGQLIAGLGIFILVIGILHLLAAVFIWAHKNWARMLGIAISVIFVLLGVLGAVGSRGSTTGTRGDSLTGALVFLVPYGFVLLALITSGSHFRRR